MKILRNPVDNWKKEITCSKCTACLEVDSSDLKKEYVQGDPRDPRESSYTRFYINCGVCSAGISIPEKELNYAVQQKAKANWRE